MIKLSFSNLFRRKTRTALSVAGIAIGVAAIIVLVSLVDGFTVQFDEIVSQFKGIAVIQKDSGDNTLSKLDASFEGKLESIPGVRAAIPELFVLPQKIDGKPLGFADSASVFVYGLDVGKYIATGSKGWVSDVEKGSWLSSSDSGSILVGKKIEEDYGKFVGSTIKINDKNFRVKGILGGQSDQVAGVMVMNLADARELSALGTEQVNEFLVIVTDPTQDKRVASLIELKYPDDLQTLTQADISKQLNDIMGSLRLLAVSIALISSIVAGIGIANTILMSILERFREIGALKAVGWTNGNIISMILYEAAFLGVIGGIMGIALGFAVDIAISSFAGVNYLISPGLLIWSFGFAVFLGLIAGVYPAYYASKLDPIDALRS